MWKNFLEKMSPKEKILQFSHEQCLQTTTYFATHTQFEGCFMYETMSSEILVWLASVGGKEDDPLSQNSMY